MAARQLPKPGRRALDEPGENLVLHPGAEASRAEVGPQILGDHRSLANILLLAGYALPLGGGFAQLFQPRAGRSQFLGALLRGIFVGSHCKAFLQAAFP